MSKKLKNKYVVRTALIDSVQGWKDTTVEIEGKWFISRSIGFYDGYDIRHKIVDIFNILRGKDFAVQFKEDRLD